MRADWEADTLGEVCELIARGVTPKYVETGGILVLNQKCVRDHRVTLDFSRRHDDSSRAVRPDRLLKVGDVLVNSTGTGTLGRVAQIRAEPDQPMTVDTHVTIVRPRAGKFHTDFFGYMLVQIEDQLAASGEGASGQTELARSTLADKFEVSYPTSLDEQRRIVAVLDKAFADIATSTANAQKNLTNAIALFQGYLNVQTAQCGSDWTTSRLEDIIQNSLIGLVKSIRDQGSHHPFLYVKMHNILNTNGFTGSNIVRVPATLEEQRKYSLTTGDFLFNTRNSHELVGKTCHFEFNGSDPVLFNNNIMRIRFKSKILSKFVSYAFCASYVSQQLEKIKSGTTNVSAIYFRDLKEVLILHPDKRSQFDIVRGLDELSLETQRLKVTYQTKLAALRELKQSLLQKAFAGELT